MRDSKYPEEKNLTLSSFVQKLQLKQDEGCQFYCDPSRHDIWCDTKNVINFSIIYAWKLLYIYTFIGNS